MSKRSSGRARGVYEDDESAAPLAPPNRRGIDDDDGGAAPSVPSRPATVATKKAHEMMAAVKDTDVSGDGTNTEKPPHRDFDPATARHFSGPKEDEDNLKALASPSPKKGARNEKASFPTDEEIKEAASSGRVAVAAASASATPSDEEIKEAARSGRVTAAVAPAAGVLAAAATNTAPREEVKTNSKIAVMEGRRQGADQSQPGAVAVTPTNRQASRDPSVHTVDDDKDSVAALAGTASPITAQLVSGDKDVKAQVEERVRQETEDIADAVQRRILDQAVLADVMEPDAKDPPEPVTSCNSKKWYIVGGVVLLLAVVGAVVGILLGTGGGGSDNSTSAPSLSPTPLPTPAPTPDPTNAPTLAPTGPDDLLQDRLEQEFGEILSGTPQAEAVEWIKEVDPLQLTVDTPFRLLKERYVTVVFYFATSGEGWTNDFGFLGGSSVCSWNDGGSILFGDGVFCDDSDSVTHIRMQANNLLGFLPSEITSLGSLEVLDIRTNGIKGEIPATIASLGSLETLDVAENFLTGTIPESLFELLRLETLYLFENRELGGALPATLGTIGAMGLRVMGLGDCRISGNIPATLAAIGSLEFLNLAGNSFVGAIPAFRNPSLDSLFLFDNNLSGEIPSSLGELPSLQRIALAENNLSGPIPLFNGSTMITDVWLYDNQLTGDIGQFLSLLVASPNLRILHVGSNRLVGSIPPFIGNFAKLNLLNLEVNSLDGPLPSEVGLLTALTSMDFFASRLTGSIPSELGLATLLNFIDLGNNSLMSSTIPSEIGNLKNLEILNLALNGLAAIPTELAALPALETLWLNGNDLDGSLDPFFCERADPLDNFRADCLGALPENECSCCTSCCQPDGGGCQEVF